MDAIRRTLTLRRVATTASLATLLIAPGAADAKGKKAKPKSPVITSVSPMRATVGDTLTIKGRNFRKGKGKNSVGFKSDGEAVVFVKAGVSTTKVMAVKIPAKLEKVMDGASTRFHLRVLADRFGKAFTSNKLSPTIAPAPAKPVPGATVAPTPSATETAPPAASPAPTDTGAAPAEPTTPPCAATNSESVDTDGDLLSDALENRIGTGGCDADSDDDGVMDGYEYKSAVDLNDDEYQQPNTAIPYPGARPYPNPLDAADAGEDYDGDGLTLEQEFRLYRYAVDKEGRSNTLSPLAYSDGLQYSVYETCPAATNPGACGADAAGKRVPALAADDYDRETATGGATSCAQASATSVGFDQWASLCNYGTVLLPDDGDWTRAVGGPAFSAGDHRYPLLDTDRNGSVSTAEQQQYELPYYGRGLGWLSDDERDEDADGLSNQTEANGPMSNQGWWGGCYSNEKPFPTTYAGTDFVNPDTDGDGIRDGADDQDHDDVPNVAETSRYAATGLIENYCSPDDATGGYDSAFGRVQPFNPCLPYTDARTCPRYIQFGDTYAPFDDSTFFSLN